MKKDTYREDGIKIAIIPGVKKINKPEKLIGCIGKFEAHVIEMEKNVGSESECVNSIQVCIKIWFF